MRFADIPGNDELKKVLVSMADSGKIPHALLLYENEGCGALALALAYIQYLNCSERAGGDSCGECPSCRRMSALVHPDTYFVFPVNASRKTDVKKPVSESFLGIWRELALSNPYFLESGLYEALGIEDKSGAIAIAEAKYILEKLSLSSVENGYKTVLMWLPEKMNQETANKLLKVVEEPPEKSMFIFITHNPDRVLQTVFSRCQSYRVMPLPADVVASVLTSRFGKEPEEAARQAALAGGSVGVALNSMGERAEYGEFRSIFEELLKGIASRDLYAVLGSADRMTAIDSKEKQKGFCIFAGECIRKIYLCQTGMQDMAAASEDEMEFFSRIAGAAGRTFCSKSIALIDRSVMLLERNVNQKMVFCDLAGQMFLNF